MKTGRLMLTLFTLLLITGCGGGGGGSAGGGDGGESGAGGASPTPDTTAPTASFSPAGSAAAVALAATIEVTFSEAVKDTTVTNINLDVKPTSASDGSSDVCSSWSLSADKKVATCTHGDLAPGVGYTITAKSAITDEAGNALAETTSAFTTTSTAGANTPVPRIALPSNDAVGGATVSLFFDRAFDPSTVTTSSIKIIKEGETANLCTAITFSGGDTIATCTLSEGFTCEGTPTKYNFTANADIRASSGSHAIKPLDDYFSNLDDGFNNAGTITPGCWTAMPGMDGGGPVVGETVNIDTTSEGKLYMKGAAGVDVTDPGDEGPMIGKEITIGAPYGVTAKIDILTGTTTAPEGGRILMSDDETFAEVFYSRFRIDAYLAGAVTGGGADAEGAAAVPVCGESCWGAASTPVYFCLTRAAGGTSFTARFDEAVDGTGAFTSLDTSGISLPTIVDNDPDPSIFLFSLIYASGAFAMEVDWVRFNVGEAACPSVDTVE